MAVNSFNILDFYLWLNTLNQFNLLSSLTDSLSKPASTTSTPDYWKTDEGLKLRVQMFSNNVSSTSYNKTLVATAEIYGFNEFIVAGPEPVCPYCIQYYGQKYKASDFMPEFPAHPNCPHIWDTVNYVHLFGEGNIDEA